MINITIKQLVELAKEAELEDPIDWKNLNLDQDQIYNLIASGLVEQLETHSEEYRYYIAIATIVRLLAENFVLNLNNIEKPIDVPKKIQYNIKNTGKHNDS